VVHGTYQFSCNVWNVRLQAKLGHALAANMSSLYTISLIQNEETALMSSRFVAIENEQILGRN
ncbi:MAG: hypothetical protein V2I33_23305, partial [Kangiellaceae bacterium]|nr:hypothetical protein [Kangiellaceae bacterium]